MDFSTFKQGQLACVTTLADPVAVSAGAGSGKTFTLTQRIAWALMDGSAPDGGRFLDGIDEVLAITFTEKAAGEIKARVKSVLRAEGMTEEALKVDAAWISTIHGMCSRILREHAVELGIDPAFGVLDEARAEELVDEAIEEALSGTNEFVGSGRLDALFGEYRARSRDAYDRSSVESMVRSLIRCAAASPRGFDCFAAQPPVRPVGSLVRELYATMTGLRDDVSALKQSDSRDAWLRKAEAFLEEASAAFDSGDMGRETLLDLFEACPFPSASFGGKEYKERAKEAQGVCGGLAQEARFLLAVPLLENLMALASDALDGYRRRKERLGMLDNDDLLILCAKALEERGDIARQYSDKFKLIMVDEFQDTDQLQVDMIERIAGPGGCKLCTVGDAQQSIYRFRGADVSVYKRRLNAVREANPRGMIVLPDNFRSHGDILSFVDRIFGQPQVFGDEFMSLSASRKEPVKHPFKAGRRVDVLLTTHPRRGGVNSAEARRIEAARIARRLAELREAGHSAGEMALLLGRMSNAGVYADALRSEGFACVVAGGSVFASAPETRIMLRLAEVIANPRETAALFEVLASDMFALSADDFIGLSTRQDETRGVFVRRGLDEGLRALERADEEGVRLAPKLACAVRVLRGLAAEAGRKPVARLMEDAVRESGWLARLDESGAEGLSIAGNVYKAIRLVERFESEGACGPAQVAHAFASHLVSAKEAPGALSAEGGDFVSIMTVHASKGLEFPIVAVAEMEKSGGVDGGGFGCEVVDGAAYVSLLPDRSVANRDGLWNKKNKVPAGYGVLPDYSGGATPSDIAEAKSPAERACAMRAYTRQQELEERRRLLYVALTRAKEALVFAMTTTQGPASGFSSGASTGVYDDVRSALFGVEDIPSGDTLVDFGGSSPALVSRLDASEEDMPSEPAASSDARRAGSFSMTEPVAPEPGAASDPAAEEVSWRPLRRDTASYSSIAQGEKGAEPGSPARVRESSDGVEDDDAAFWDALRESLASDADKSTDFGTAFHLLAQRMAAGVSAGCFDVPDDEAIARISSQCGLGAGAVARLRSALERWHGSDLAARVLEHSRVRAEVPFFVMLNAPALDGFSLSDVGEGRAGENGIYLEGSIDLFANDAEGTGPALIVDYKTGGTPDEDEGALAAKHGLQASCYAYAALRAGYEPVEAVFVRVERCDESACDQPQSVSYRFERGDLDALEKRIARAYVRSR